MLEVLVHQWVSGGGHCGISLWWVVGSDGWWAMSITDNDQINCCFNRHMIVLCQPFAKSDTCLQHRSRPK